MSGSETLLYTARVRTAGGRDGMSRSKDGRLDVQLSHPGGLGSGTNPEQLLAAGWSASFGGGLAEAAREMEVTSRVEPVIEAEMDLNRRGDGTYCLRGRLSVHLPGPDRELARLLVERAHQICPFTKAMRGNVEVAIALV